MDPPTVAVQLAIAGAFAVGPGGGSWQRGGRLRLFKYILLRIGVFFIVLFPIIIFAVTGVGYVLSLFISNGICHGVGPVNSVPPPPTPR